MAEKTENKVVRDVDVINDFDPNTGDIKNKEMKAHFDAEREKLLGQPVAGTSGKYAVEPEKIERAAAGEKVVLSGDESIEFLTKRYSRKQLTEYAKANKVEFGERDSAVRVATLISKAQTAKANTDTALTVLPAAPEINQDKIEQSDGEIETSEDVTTAKG